METLGLILGSSFASGLNLYATVATLGLLHRFDIIQLPQSLEAVSHPVAIGLALTLYLVEFVADKIPYVDTTWDVVHSFIRPPAAAVLAYGSVGDVASVWGIAAGLLAGSVALSSHAAKATTRMAINASPEPFTNSVASIAEDGIAVSLVWMATTHPYITIAVVLVLITVSIYIVVKLFRFFRSVLRRVSRLEFRRKPRLPSTSNQHSA